MLFKELRNSQIDFVAIKYSKTTKLEERAMGENLSWNPLQNSNTKEQNQRDRKSRLEHTEFKIIQGNKQHDFIANSDPVNR